MKLTFLGANHEVTGSCTLLEAAGQRYLIDCGMEQGKDIYENQPIPVAPGEIDGVLATHAHIDHTGLLPLLVRNGFRGKIYATKPTTELCDIMLRDSAHIQEFEAEWKNRKAKRAGDAPVEPMYTVQDAEAAMKLFIGVDYETKVELAPGLEIRFVDVGHLLGSSSIEIWVTENGSTTKLVFSGDIGNTNQPLIKDPAYITDADYVVMESTYGDRLHGPKPDYVAELSKILQRTFDRGGNVVIPSFAVGRTLIDGATTVKLFGETIEVQADICQLTGLSGHADKDGLLRWVNSFEPKPKRVFIVHGNDEVEDIFAQTLKEQGFTASAPYNGEQWGIGAEGAVCIKEGNRVHIEHRLGESASRAATVFQRLVNAGKRLLRVIEHNEGGANKDLAKFADQINALCDKWDR